MRRINIYTKSNDSRSRQNVRGIGTYTVRDIVTAREVRRADGLELGGPTEYGFVSTRWDKRMLVSLVGGQWWGSTALMSEVVDLIIERPTNGQ